MSNFDRVPDSTLEFYVQRPYNSEVRSMAQELLDARAKLCDVCGKPGTGTVRLNLPQRYPVAEEAKQYVRSSQTAQAEGDPDENKMYGTGMDDAYTPDQPMRLDPEDKFRFVVRDETRPVFEFTIDPNTNKITFRPETEREQLLWDLYEAAKQESLI
jgi:hypothetical protein